MKRVFLLGAIALSFGLISVYAQQCDYIDPLKTLRYNEGYTFTDTFTNVSSTEVEITRFEVTPFPTKPPLQILFNPGQTALIYSQKLSINEKQSFTGQYIVDYCATDDPSNCDRHTECAPYKVTRCGDGILDTQLYSPGETWQVEICDTGTGVGAIPVIPYNVLNPTLPLVQSYCTALCQDGEAIGPYCGDKIYDIGFEECGEPGAPICSTTATCIDCKCVESTPVCNSDYNGQSFYTTDINYLNGKNLCQDPFITSPVTFNPGTNTWSRTCTNAIGESSACQANRLFCGNDIVENDNQIQFPPSGASEQCELLPNGISLGCATGFTCNDLCTCEPIPVVPVCGTNANQLIYIAKNNGQSSINENAPGLCNDGSKVLNFIYNPGIHTWTWTCSNAAGQTSSVCSISEAWCGDNKPVPIVYWNQYSDANPIEQCDFGTDNMNIPCEAPYGGSCNYCTTACQSITLTGGMCGDGIINDDELCDNGPNNGMPCMPGYGDFCKYCSNTCKPEVVTGPRCGDGIYHDPILYIGSTEQCDGSANVPQNHRCNEICKLVCDDPDAINFGEAELCKYTGTFCGDGTVQNPNSQGIAELCDEGQKNAGGCTPTYGLEPGCTYCDAGSCVPITQSLVCGDGIWTQQYEQCEDDGQLGITDSVTQLCQDCIIICKDPEAINYLQPGICDYPKTYCGDGIIQSPNDDGQFEACDDGVNNGPLGYCSSMCTINTSDPKYPDLVIEKTILHQSTTIVSATGTISFQLRYVNAGAAPAVGVVIRDVLPSHLTYISYQSLPGLTPPTVNGQELVFTIGTLLPGQGGTITIHTTKLAQDICLNTTNTATITIPPGDPTPGNNTSTVAIPCDEGLCQSLSVVEHTGTAPLTSYFNCQGQGSDYVISIYNQQGALIHTINAPSGAYTFAQPGSYSAICTVDGRTSSTCKKTIDVTGRCEQLSVDISSGATVPLTGNLSCTGNGEIFEILLYKDNILQKSWKQVGGPVMKVSYTFTQAGKRSAICYVDGVSNPVCTEPKTQLVDGHFITDGEETIVQSLGLTDEALQQFKKSLVAKQYEDLNIISKKGVLDTSILFEGKQREEMQQFIDKDMQIKQQADDLISAYISHQFSEISTISKQEISPTTLVEQSSFHEYIKRQSQIYTTTQQKHCHDDCAIDFLLVSPPNLGYCGDALIQTPNGSGFNEQCDHGMTGNNGTAIINGIICDKECKKVTGGGGGTSGSYGGTPPSTPPSSGGSRCGDGKRDVGEACDLGSANGSNSLCTTTCTLRGFTTNSPLCEYVDPPSIQIGEPLPLWWNYEGDSSIVTDITCNTGSVGTISRDSLTCHFAILNPLGQEVDRISTDCEQDSLRQQTRYKDFITTLDRDTRSLLLQSRGVSVWDSNRIINKNPIFGEYAVRLDRISYDVCRWDGTSFAYTPDSYDERVCQYNFSVTHPYLLQKSVTNSSTIDDIKILDRFYDFAGRRLLADINFTPIQRSNSSDILAKIDTIMKQYSDTATILVRDAGHPLFGYRKAANRELYIMDATTWTIDTTLSFNRGKTTIVYAPNATDIMIKGSLDARLILLAPRATIQFINTDCHVSDTIGGIYVAADFTTNSIKNQANQEQRCTGGGLVIDGMLIGGIADSITALAQRRRSTLNNWFTTRDKDGVIFDGASLRIQANPSLWNDMPTLMSELMEVLTVTK